MSIKCIALALGLVAGSSIGASATTITFGDANIDRLDLAGSITESGFQYQVVIGTGWELQTDFGNPGAALTTFYNDESAALDDFVSITRSGGGAFTFDSVDFRTITSEDSDHIKISGLRNGSLVGALALTTPSTVFTTVASTFGGPVDKLFIEITSIGFSAAILDNFNLTEIDVPLPATLPLFATGLACLGVVMHGRRSAATTS